MTLSRKLFAALLTMVTLHCAAADIDGGLHERKGKIDWIDFKQNAVVIDDRQYSFASDVLVHVSGHTVPKQNLRVGDNVQFKYMADGNSSIIKEISPASAP